MRKIIVSLLACGMIYGCVQATELKATEPKPTAPKLEVKTSHAHLNADFKVYDPDANAMVNVDRALARAKARGTNALIIMGANWCHDSRGLAARFDKPEFKSLISEDYELVYVSAGTNPGQKNQNKEVSQRFGVEQIGGTPTVFIVDGDKTVLNADSAGYWRRADSIPTDMSYAYFKHYSTK